MHDEDQTPVQRTPHPAKPPMPREQFREELLQTRPKASLVAPFPQRAHRAGGDGRLRDAGGARCPACCPDRRPGEITRVVLPEDDVRQKSVFPLPLEQRLDLAPCAIQVECSEPERREGRIPVPLERVHAAVRHGVGPPIVAKQNRARPVVELLHGHRLTVPRWHRFENRLSKTFLSIRYAARAAHRAAWIGLDLGAAAICEGCGPICR